MSQCAQAHITLDLKGVDRILSWFQYVVCSPSTPEHKMLSLLNIKPELAWQGVEKSETYYSDFIPKCCTHVAGAIGVA